LSSVGSSRRSSLCFMVSYFGSERFSVEHGVAQGTAAMEPDLEGVQ
jgi:hypothetical protein